MVEFPQKFCQTPKHGRGLPLPRVNVALQQVSNGVVCVQAFVGHNNQVGPLSSRKGPEKEGSRSTEDSSMEVSRVVCTAKAGTAGEGGETLQAGLE